MTRFSCSALLFPTKLILVWIHTFTIFYADVTNVSKPPPPHVVSGAKSYDTNIRVLTKHTPLETHRSCAYYIAARMQDVRTIT